nr:MAG TPA: hypothetical protein [Caudoviricetes sp.]
MGREMEGVRFAAKGIIGGYARELQLIKNKIDEYEAKDALTDEEMKDWKVLELRQLNGRNESQAVLNAIVEMGILTPKEAVIEIRAAREDV